MEAAAYGGGGSALGLVGAFLASFAASSAMFKHSCMET
jgi:hypothetical protein